MYLFDSSAIAIVLRRFGEKSLDLLEGEATLDLALYELGNVVWKEYALRKSMGKEEAIRRVNDLSSVLRLMDTMTIALADLSGVMKVAVEWNLTFYDSSYLYIAKKLGATLVTEDDELLRKAKEAGVKAERVEEHVKSLLHHL